MLEGAEILIDAPMARRGRQMLTAMAAAAPTGSETTDRYRGRHKTLVLYGAGLAQRMHAMQTHRRAGGTVVVWDLGYWDREEAMRLAIGSLHPTPEQMARAPAGWRRDHGLREDADPTGPILLVGLGRKSAALYGLQPMEWERRKLRELQSRFPGRRVIWRPKGKEAEHLPGTVYAGGGSIESALRGCSLVVCRHSNVAIDACVAGVPVECEAGAALAIYSDGRQPTRDERREFLRRLGWWNWRPGEAAQAWEWIAEVTA